MRPLDAGAGRDHRADCGEAHSRVHGPPAQGATSHADARIGLRCGALARRTHLRFRSDAARQLGLWRLISRTSALPNPQAPAISRFGPEGTAVRVVRVPGATRRARVRAGALGPLKSPPLRGLLPSVRPCLTMPVLERCAKTQLLLPMPSPHLACGNSCHSLPDSVRNPGWRGPCNRNRGISTGTSAEPSEQTRAGWGRTAVRRKIGV